MSMEWAVNMLENTQEAEPTRHKGTGFAWRVEANRMIRFIAVGALNTTVGYGIYVVLLLLGFAYQVANFFALVGGILFSFKTQSALVFHKTSEKALFRFTLCWLFIYLCNIGLIGLLLDLGFDAYTAGALGIPPIVVLSYMLQKHFVFNAAERRRES